MRYSLLPDPERINYGFLKRDRVNGLGAAAGDAPATPLANGAAPTFLGSLGSTFLDLSRAYAPSLINWGITGNQPQSVVATTPTGQQVITTIPGGTQTLSKATGQMPTWLVPALIGGAALLFLVARKK